MAEYIFKHNHPTESARMDLMASALDEASKNHMSRLPIRPDWACLEIGAGNGSLSQWLAPQVHKGKVTVTDLQPDLIAGITGPNIAVEKLDLTEGLPEESHDFIFLRAVLHHLPERKEAIGTLVQALKPGGWLFVHEPDLHPINCSLPEICRPLWDGFDAWASDLGIDYSTGRRIPELLQAHGMSNITSAGHTEIYPGGSVHAEWLRVTIAEVSKSMLKAGNTSVEHLEAFDKASRDPSVWHATFSFVGTTAQRPET